MQVDLQGHVAWVTGGAHGIGRAIVEALARSGAKVALLDIDETGAQAAAAELSAAGLSVRAWVADVTDRERIATLEREIGAELGPCTVLVNNAGINRPGSRPPLHEYPDADWDRILRVDLTGVFYVSRAVIPAMIQRQQGRIINIASVAGIVPLRSQSAYVAAKAGVVNLSRSMALEFGPHGILTNCVAPGSTLTRATREFVYGSDAHQAEKAASLLSHIPLGRPGTPEEIAHAVLFLAAPEASYINGAVLTVDGGWTAGYTRDW